MGHKDDSDPSIEDLCKPLSAKVMPRSASWNIGGREMDPSRVLSSQRRSVTMKKKRKDNRHGKEEG